MKFPPPKARSSESQGSEDRDNLLFLRSSEDGPWEVDAVASEFADSVLQHWEFARPSWLADTPEFEAGVYKGEFFRESFQQW